MLTPKSVIDVGRAERERYVLEYEAQTDSWRLFWYDNDLAKLVRFSTREAFALTGVMENDR